MPINPAAEKMIFNYGTTYLTDYRGFEIKDPVFTKYKERPKKPINTNIPPLRDLHTMTTPKKPVPFTLYHKPKEIVRENPRIIQTKYEKPIETGLDEVIATRPRYVIPPAFSLDDLKDKETRKKVINDTYMSTATKANNERPSDYFSVKSPLPGPPAPALPIFLPHVRLPKVPEELRMETVTWDGKQLRAFTSPTEKFWLNRELPPCSVCEQTAIVVADRLQKRKNKQ